MRQGHCLAGEPRREERTGVGVAIPLHAASHQHARKRLAGRQLQVRVALVVAQQDVVFRRALLDQVVFERERLDDRVGHDDLESIGFVEQRVGLRVDAVRAKIAAHAVAEGARLAHVNRLAGRVEVQVDSRAAPATARSGP